MNQVKSRYKNVSYKKTVDDRMAQAYSHLWWFPKDVKHVSQMNVKKMNEQSDIYTWKHFKRMK